MGHAHEGRAYEEMEEAVRGCVKKGRADIMIYHGNEVRMHLNCGDVVWAFAFAETASKDNMRLMQKPVKGRLANSNGRRFIGRMDVFVPFRKGLETEYAWSKAVSLGARCFAGSEAEAAEAYNARVDRVIRWYEEKIKELQEKKIMLQEARAQEAPVEEPDDWDL